MSGGGAGGGGGGGGGGEGGGWSVAAALHYLSLAPSSSKLRWLEGVLIFPSLAFYCSYTNNVEVKPLVQLCKGLIYQ